MGDLNVFPLEPQRTCEILSDQSQRIAATGATLFAIGGDYSVTPALLRGVAREIGSLAVMRISSRLDLQPIAAGPADAPWRCNAASELAEILPNQLSAIALLGGRGTLPAEERASASEAIVVPASELVAAPEEAIRKAAGFALKTSGYEVVTYASGVEFLKSARSAETGCVIEYDLFGQENSLYPSARHLDMPNDAQRLQWLSWLIAEGHGSQIVVAHDIDYKMFLVRYGGHGYAHILENIVPRMRTRGFREEDIQAILVDTPRRVLTFAEPQDG